MISSGHLREELIQVAAVAIAAVQDLDLGTTEFFTSASWEGVLTDVIDERFRQEKKWGPQSHTAFEWLAILGEEYGEACQAAVDSHDWTGGA